MKVFCLIAIRLTELEVGRGRCYTTRCFGRRKIKKKCFIVLQKALRVFDVALVVGHLRPPCWADAAGLLRRRRSGVEEAEPEVGLLREVLQVEEVGDEVPPD